MLCVAIGGSLDWIGSDLDLDLVKLIPHACYHQLFKFILITFCVRGGGMAHGWGVPKMKRSIIWFVPREKDFTHTRTHTHILLFFISNLGKHLARSKQIQDT